MLILTRKIGETIQIGDNVTVKVLALRGGQVSLGFTAPTEVRIFREEVLLTPPPEVSEVLPAKRPARARLAERSGERDLVRGTARQG
jgi:carbon storage regulator